MAVLTILTAGCAGNTGDDSLRKVIDAGEFILGFDIGFPPMGFLNEQGEAVGFDIDVAKEVCKRLGVRLVTKGIDWDKKEDELNTAPGPSLIRLLRTS